MEIDPALRGVRGKVGRFAVDSQRHDSPPHRVNRYAIVPSCCLTYAVHRRLGNLAAIMRHQEQDARRLSKGPAPSLGGKASVMSEENRDKHLLPTFVDRAGIPCLPPSPLRVKARSPRVLVGG